MAGCLPWTPDVQPALRLCAGPICHCNRQHQREPFKTFQPDIVIVRVDVIAESMRHCRQIRLVRTFKAMDASEFSLKIPAGLLRRSLESALKAGCVDR